jgi:replicative DNA helicase
MVLGGTGVGKTAILSNIAVSALPLPTLLFELELPPEVLFERLVALKMEVDCGDVERSYATGEKAGRDALYRRFPNLFVCTEAKLTVEKIKEYCDRAELKIGRRPGLVLIDYVGLIDGAGSSRYDKFSTIAENLKVMAKQIRAVVVCAVQISRKAKDESDEVGLTDGKDSGSIENSAGVVLGCWRPAADRMAVRVLKNTKGRTGVTVDCNYNGAQLRITERSPIDDADIPRGRRDL